MFCGPELLERYARLKELGLAPQLEPGSRVARGFADLGFEEFVLLPGRKLLSLFRGSMTEFNNEEIDDLIFLPDSEQMIDILSIYGYRIRRLSFEDQRNWKLELERDDGRKQTFEAGTLLLVLISGLESALLQRRG